ncbi:MAG: methyltransferase domain-containing protein [Planctomycetota bacterium]
MTTGTTRIEQIAEAYHLSYHLDLLKLAQGHGLLAGKRVLEIGGSLPEELVVGHFGVERWVCVDRYEDYRALEHRGHAFYAQTNPRAFAADQPIYRPGRDALPAAAWSRFDGDAGDLSTAFDSQFDLVVSIATFEHVQDLPGALRALRRALVPGGHLALLVGPIWSGSRGHHIYRNYFPDFAEQTARFLSDLEPWGHLLHTRSEMFARNRERFGAEFAELVGYCLYEAPHLNRLFADEYFDYFAQHGMAVVQNYPWGPDPVEKKVWKQVRKLYPAHRDFEWDGFTCLLRAR